jgi:hypothetical protein
MMLAWLPLNNPRIAYAAKLLGIIEKMDCPPPY